MVVSKWPSGSGAGLPIQGSWVLNHLVTPTSTQPFILPSSIIWVPGAPGDRVVKSRLYPSSGSVALRQLNTIHKKEDFFFRKIMQKFYSQINLNLNCKKKLSVKANLTLGCFPVFHFYNLSLKASENEMKISQMSSFIWKIANFYFRKMYKIFL